MRLKLLLMQLRKLFGMILLLALHNELLGQQLGNFIEKSQSIFIPFSVTCYGTKHGLPQNQILDIIQKRDGELIISTANGIVEYNGHEFYPITNDAEHKRHIHGNIYWSNAHKILFGSENGGNYNKITPAFKKTRGIFSAYLKNETLFWITKNGRIYSRKLGSKHTRLILDSKVKNVYTLYLDKNNCYLSTRNSTYHFNLNTGVKTLLCKEFIIKIRKNPFTGIQYALSSDSLYTLKGIQLQPVDLGVEKKGILTDVEFISNDEIFVSSTMGLIYHNSYYGERYEETDYLPTNYIQSLYYDKKEQCLFAGTGNKGLLKLQIKNCSSMVENTDLAKASLCSIIKDHQNRVLIASSDTKIYQLELGGCSTFFQDKSGFSTMSEIDNTLFIGTWGNGVITVKNQQKTGHITYPKLNSNIVHAIYKDLRGNIWIGTFSGVSSGKTIQELKPFHPLKITGRIITFYERRNGDICIGGSKGVYIINKQHQLIKKIGKKEGLNCKEVRSFYEDEEKKLWIGTYDGGLYCFANNQLTSINQKSNCKLNNDLFTLAKDSRGSIYMTSNNGLYVVSEKKLNDYYNGKIDYLIPFYYGNENGIKNTEFNGGFQNNFLMTKRDHLYLPTIEGVLVTSPDDYLFRKLTPKIKSVLINDTIINRNNSTFSRNTHSIEFNFYCSNYISKYNIHYQYKLLGPGLPNQWSKIQKNDNIRFSMLPPGNYNFQIRGVDAYNDAFPKIQSYSFRIKPYFYETWWFLCLIILFILFISIYIIRLRIYQLRVRERKEHRISNTFLELKLKAIQSKMNPHFIFNSLNNIIYLLNSNQVREAEDLLQDFSLLLRQFLQSSDQTFISLQEEFAILELYLAIEQRRKNGEFTYTFLIDEELKDKQIPTLLLQPIVENAIKHGIGHSNQLCTITIEAKIVSDFIQIQISDNGIGRKASEKMNEYRKNHTSMGFGLVKEKINIMHLKYDKLISLVVEDLDHVNQTGTVVTLKIPLND